MEIVLIRHSITAGNLARRYVGRTDEGLCPEGIELAKAAAVKMPKPDLLYVSPMLRCKETAFILFPEMRQTVIDGLRETDFGSFEYKTYDELKDDEAYRAWLDSGGESPIPGGESQSQVRQRVMEAFNTVLMDIMLSDYTERAALVVHGGTIMTIMSALGQPEREYYGWQVKNCGGFVTAIQGERLTVLRELTP